MPPSWKRPAGNTLRPGPRLARHGRGGRRQALKTAMRLPKGGIQPMSALQKHGGRLSSTRPSVARRRTTWRFAILPTKLPHFRNSENMEM